MAMLRYDTLPMELLSRRLFFPEKQTKKRELASPSEADALLFQPVLCFLSVVGSSSIIAYAVFQNAVRSPEVRSDLPSPSLSRGVGPCRWVTPVTQTLS